MQIIGIAGRAGAGKTTVAKALVNHMGYTVLSFASPLKESVMNIFDMTPSQVYSTEGKSTIDPRYNKTPREILQLFGTESIRNIFGNDFWVKKLQKTINELPTNRIVIDDVRFKEEAEMILEMGGEIWKIERPEEEHLSWLDKLVRRFIPEHSSEIPLPMGMIDHIIENDWDIDRLKFRVRALYNSLYCEKGSWK